ncbi:MAG: HigA family addiction module antitoxin [Acidimicrobiales bacterium]
MATTTAPINPGELLLVDFLEPTGVAQHRLAVSIGVPPRQINEIVHGKHRISADTVPRLARFFGTSERFWINPLTRYDLEFERDRLGSSLEAITPLVSARPRRPNLSQL